MIEMPTRERNKEIKALVNQWMKNNNGKIFCTDDFCKNNGLINGDGTVNKDERNTVTKHIRDMAAKFDDRKLEIEKGAKKLGDLDRSKTIEKVIEHLEESFLHDAGCPYSEWIEKAEEQKFQYLKDLMEKSDIYYRINKDRWFYIDPIFQERIEQSWNKVFPKIDVAASAMQVNLGYMMAEDVNRLTVEECTNCVKGLQKVAGTTRFLHESALQVLEKYTNAMLALNESMAREFREIRGEGENNAKKLTENLSPSQDVDRSIGRNKDIDKGKR